MHITLSDTGKRYNRDWVFRHLDYEFLPGKTYAITGPNGSGKSTLLQVIAGAVMQSEGKIMYINSGKPEQLAGLHRNISFAAPYMELIEEMTATELLHFHSTFKKLIKPVPDILEETSLEKSAHKQVRYFSSGMKQRLKLAQAFFSDTLVLLLDEPLTNLDDEGIELYHNLTRNHAKEKMIIISSNDKQEYDFCEKVIGIGNYK